MTATILKFPPRGRFDVRIRVEREADAPGWLVLTHDGEHGWTHGDFSAALDDAGVIAAGLGVSVRSSASRITP
jgi:hypothetical protein